MDLQIPTPDEVSAAQDAKFKQQVYGYVKYFSTEMRNNGKTRFFIPKDQEKAVRVAVGSYEAAGWEVFVCNALNFTGPPYIEVMFLRTSEEKKKAVQAQLLKRALARQAPVTRYDKIIKELNDICPQKREGFASRMMTFIRGQK